MQVFKEALAALGDLSQVERLTAIVLGSRSWHPGVIGIVASRISRMFHRPTILVAIDEHGMGKGSGRSIPGFSLVEAIEYCNAHLVRGGGHAMAAGISVEEAKLDSFRTAFQEAARLAFEGGLSQPIIELDSELDFRDLTSEFYAHYRLLEPFGQRNNEPIFLARNVQPKLPARVMKEKHLRVLIAPIGNLPPAPWDVALRMQRNWFRGEERWQFTLDAVRPATI
jgi:single-stranded-DNA-specific exonuclease